MASAGANGGSEYTAIGGLARDGDLWSVARPLGLSLLALTLAAIATRPTKGSTSAGSEQTALSSVMRVSF